MIFMDSNFIFTVGLAVVGVSVLISVVAVPIFFFLRSSLNKKLNSDYGKIHEKIHKKG